MAKRAKPIECNELGGLLAEIAIHYGTTGVNSIDAVVPKVASHFPDFKDQITREAISDSIVGYMRSKKKAVITEAQKNRAKIINEAKADRGSRELADRVEEALNSDPHKPLAKKTRPEVVKAIKNLREIEAAIRKNLKAKERILEVEKQKASGKLSDSKPKQEGPKEELIAKREAANKELNALRKKLQEPNVGARREAIKKRIEELNKKIALRDLSPSTVKKQGPKDELESERDRLSEQLSNLRKDDNRVKELREEIASISKQIATKTFDESKPAERRVQSQEVQELQAQADRLRHLRELVKTEIELTRQLDEGDFPKTQSVEKKVDLEIMRLQSEIMEKRQAIQAAIKSREPWSWRDALSIPNAIFKTINTGWDASYPLRQGVQNISRGIGQLVTLRPGEAARTFGGVARSFADQIPLDAKKGFQKLKQGQYMIAAKHFKDAFLGVNSERDLAAQNAKMEAENPLLWLRAKKAGLPLGRAEEFEHRHSKISEVLLKIPGGRLSNFAFTAAGNRMRWDLFKAMNATYPNATKEEMAAMASFIGDMTLRGKIDAKTAQRLNDFFFSVRALKARINWWSLHGIRHAPTKEMRKAIAKQYLDWLMGAMTLLGAAAFMGLTDLNPASSDFMKIKLGERRIDPFAGLGGVATLAWRLTFGETKPISGKNKGKVMSLVDKQAEYSRGWGDVILDFVASKTSPAASLYYEALRRREYMKEPGTFDLRRAIIKRSIPLSLQESYSHLQKEGWSNGSILSALSMLGLGIRNHEEEPNSDLPESIMRLLGWTPKGSKPD